jgi:hypothetical protein
MKLLCAVQNTHDRSANAQVMSIRFAGQKLTLLTIA